MGLLFLHPCHGNLHDDSDKDQDHADDQIAHQLEEEVQPLTLQSPSGEVDDSQILPDENDVVVDKRLSDEDDDGTARRVDNTFPNSDVYSTGGRNFYSYQVFNIDGEKVQLRKYRNKVSLVVNVASECGFTDGHYKSLVRMQSMLGGTGKFNVLAFPCNQFGAQEPGNNNEIKNFAEQRYQVNFPMFSKIQVLDSNIPEAWKYLEEKSGKVPNWNFWKYLVNDDGDVVDAWGPWTSVEDIFDQVKAVVDRISKPKDPELPNVVTQDRTEL
ncbi:glutathione peroxidase 7-like [Liolophura sinensis]|uniref:glutathione peroxidase 7-like n=1 Tax=Liolophura sinensis TaxID=3198878 RepID=UPI0031582C0C